MTFNLAEAKRVMLLVNIIVTYVSLQPIFL